MNDRIPLISRKSNTKYPNYYKYNDELKCTELIISNHRGEYTILIDSKYYDFCKKHHWQITSSGYVICVVKGVVYYLHREIMNVEDGAVVDHVNGNTMDNRENNLRVCTQKDNSRNLHIYRNDIEILGVRKDKRCKNSYRAQIYLSSNQHIEKTYKDKELAIIQRLCWEIMYFKDYAPQIELIKEKYPYLLNYKKVEGSMVFNDDIETVKTIGDSLLKDPHCPCMLKQNDNTLCPCLPCRKSSHCCCEMFKPIKDDNNILKTKYPDIYEEWLASVQVVSE